MGGTSNAIEVFLVMLSIVYALLHTLQKGNEIKETFCSQNYLINAHILKESKKIKKKKE